MKLLFAGTPPFAASALDALAGEHQILAVLTQPDRPAGRGMKLTPSAVKQRALAGGFQVLQPPSLKNGDIQETLRAFNADVMVVAAYGLILPQAVLDIPRLGCLNIHASLLPRWRGAAPIQRAIQAGDAETGITIMQMDAGLDTGAMLLRRALPILADDTAQILHDKLASLGAEAILESLRQLESGMLEPQPQLESDATYAAKLLKTESRIDWQLDSAVLARTVRAFNPFPGCHCERAQQPVKVWQARETAGTALPGTVLAADDTGITVACGRGALCLETLQRAGGKAQSAAQFLQAVPVAIGERWD